MAKKNTSNVPHRRRRADVDLKAARFVSDIMMDEDWLLLPKINAWLRKDPSGCVCEVPGGRADAARESSACAAERRC